MLAPLCSNLPRSQFGLLHPPLQGRSDHREHDIGEGRDKPSDHVDRRRRSYSRDRDRRRRSRSRSSDRRRYRSRSRSRDRRGSRRDRYPSPRRDRDRQRDRRRGGGGGPTTEEDELKKLDRTLRTVQAYNLSLRAEERDIFKLFSQAGPIMDIKIIRDRTTGRSKGFAYIEYQHHESVAPGLHLTGQLILGQPVMVKGSEAEKNMAWEAAQAAKRQAAMGISAAAAAPAAGTVPGRLLVSNLHPSLTEADLRPIFDNFGPVDFMMLQRDAMGVSQGTAILQYQNAAHATSARDNLSGVLDIQGMKIMLIDAPLEYNPAMAGVPGVTVPGMSGAAAPAVVEERLDVDADDGGGMRMTAQSRVELMSRLAANAGIEVPQLPTYGMGGPMGPAVGQPAGGVPQELAMEQGVLGPASPIPTQCLLIKNMFDPAE